VVDALISLSDAQVFSPNYVAAEKTLREALPVARTVYGAEHPSIANVSSRLGAALWNQRRLEEAEPLMRDALAMRIKLLGEQHPDVQLSRVDLARVMQAQARFAEAETLLTQALAGRRAVLGDSSPAIASTLLDLAILARNREDWPAAESHLRQAIPIWHAAQIEDQELYTLAELGFALQQQNRVDEADSVLAGVLVRRRALFGAEHWSVGDTYEKMAAVALRRRDAAHAESLGTLGLSIRQKVYGPRSAQVAVQMINVASYVEARGDTSRAIPLVRESLSLLATRPPTDLNVLAAQRALAIDLCATGQAAQGDSLIRVAISHLPPNALPSFVHRVRGALGYCLTRAQRYAEAEPVLLEAESGLRAPVWLATSREVTVRWLVSLYEQWGKPEQAAAWKQRLVTR
jgi:tetratricopeptide (TPR) repeat protein